MELLKQCQIWNKDNKYQEIIDALESIPADERTPEMDSELGRAYNNLADPSLPEGRDMLRRAIDFLSPHEEYFKDEHNWNFRMGYAYYYLDQEGIALRYFRKALEARPGDDDTQEMIERCKDSISLPRFIETFRQRTIRAWEVFSEKESELRCFMDNDKKHERGDELIVRFDEILKIAFYNVSFEVGKAGEKYELILTPEGDYVKLFELVYFQNHAPAEILKNWNILVGRQPQKNIGMKIHGLEANCGDVQVWLEQSEDSGIRLFAYCKKLSEALSQNENSLWWILTTLTDQILGEIPHMRYIDGFEVLDKPLEKPAVLLSELPEQLRNMGLELSADPKLLLERYTSYSMEPDKDHNSDWRLDIIAGSTNCTPIIGDYYENKSDYIDDLHADGAVAGFIYYSLDGFTGDDRSQQIFDFRDKLEAAIFEGEGAEIAAFTGGATGLFYGYVDFIAWDLPRLLTEAKAFFEDTNLKEVGFHVFRRETLALDFIKSKHDSKGQFIGSVLLSKAEWNKEQLISDLKAKWNIIVENEDDNETLVFQIDDMFATASLFSVPVSNGEAEECAKNNYMWQEAEKAAQDHKAHILVTVLSKDDDDLIERGKLYTKLMAACCRQKYVTGVYTSGVVFEPHFYEDFADVLKEDELPIFNWIWFGLYQREGRVCAYTYGMDLFGKDEMEVLDADAEPEEVRDFLVGMASYVLEYDVELRDGETIGFSENDKHAITYSKGTALPEQLTIKISYEALE